MSRALLMAFVALPLPPAGATAALSANNLRRLASAATAFRGRSAGRAAAAAAAASSGASSRGQGEVAPGGSDRRRRPPAAARADTDDLWWPQAEEGGGGGAEGVRGGGGYRSAGVGRGGGGYRSPGAGGRSGGSGGYRSPTAGGRGGNGGYRSPGAGGGVRRGGDGGVGGWEDAPRDGRGARAGTAHGWGAVPPYGSDAGGDGSRGAWEDPPRDGRERRSPPGVGRAASTAAAAAATRGLPPPFFDGITGEGGGGGGRVGGRSSSWEDPPRDGRERRGVRRDKGQRGGRLGVRGGASDRRGSRGGWEDAPQDGRGAPATTGLGGYVDEWSVGEGEGGARGGRGGWGRAAAGGSGGRGRSMAAEKTVSEMTELQATLASGDDLLYGTAPVLAALRAGRRSRFEALYVRGEEGGSRSDRGSGGGVAAGVPPKADGTEAGREIRRLARVRQVPVRSVAKGDLNVLCGNRPHQGYVLQAAPLEWVPIKALPPLTGRWAPAVATVKGKEAEGVASADAIDAEEGSPLVGAAAVDVAGATVGGGGVINGDVGDEPTADELAAADAAIAAAADAVAPADGPATSEADEVGGTAGAVDTAGDVSGDGAASDADSEDSAVADATDADALPPVWLALDEVTDPQNMGALLRSAYFLGATGVVACGRNSSALTATVSKASAGAMEAFPLHSVNSMPRLLSACRAAGWRVVGTALDDTAVAVPALSRDVPTVVVMGSEGHGLRPLVVAACDVLVRIGGKRVMGDGEVYAVDSLNVSVAAGVVLHQLLGE